MGRDAEEGKRGTGHREIGPGEGPGNWSTKQGVKSALHSQKVQRLFCQASSFPPDPYASAPAPALIDPSAHTRFCQLRRVSVS
jgi:hypothetical protein